MRVSLRLCGLLELDERRVYCVYFVFQAEDGIRDLVRSRGLGDVYKRQHAAFGGAVVAYLMGISFFIGAGLWSFMAALLINACLLYTSDAADDLPCVDLGGCRIN